MACYPLADYCFKHYAELMAKPSLWRWLVAVVKSCERVNLLSSSVFCNSSLLMFTKTILVVLLLLTICIFVVAVSTLLCEYVYSFKTD